MSFGSRLKEKREQLGLTQVQLAGLLGVTKGAIGNYETEVSSPKAEILYKVFDILHCDANYLFQDEMNTQSLENQLSIAESKIIKKYRELDFHGKSMVNLVLDEEHRRAVEYMYQEQIEEPANVVELNFSEQPSSAGTGYWLDEEQMIKKKVMLNRDTAKADFCVPVSGDSMTPQFNDGDILLVRKQPAVDIGQIGIFTIDGTGFVKKFGIGQLESLNSKYEPIPINEDTDLICNGKVLGVLNPEWIVED